MDSRFLSRNLSDVDDGQMDTVLLPWPLFLDSV